MDPGEREAQPSTSPQPSGSTGGLAGYFKFAERGTNLATEAKAGLTTFMVMAYILFLNPAILSNMFGPPGSPEATAFIPAAAAATALIAGLLTIAMGVIANTPLAMAAGLGINGAVAFGLVLTQGLTPGRRDGRDRPRRPGRDPAGGRRPARSRSCAPCPRP